MSVKREETAAEIEAYIREHFWNKDIIEPAITLLKNLCTDDFLSDMFYNLENVFGRDRVTFIFTDEVYEFDGEEYQDVETGKGPIYDFYSSSHGWFLALRETFKTHPIYEKQYYTLYTLMDWMDSDVFDGAIEAYLDAWYRNNLTKLKKK